MNYKSKDLWFEHSDGTMTLIAENIDKENIIPTIKEYIALLNPEYEIYYVREWTRNGVITFDVGSHTEFFHYCI